MIGFTSLLQAIFGAQRKCARRPRTILGVEVLEDRRVPSSSPVVNFSVTQDWGTGFQAQLAIANPATGADVPNWKLEFQYPAQITDIWDATIISHTGDDYVIGNAGWNSDLAPGSTVSFGFNADDGSAQAQPTGYVLDGVPLGVTPPLPSLTIGNVTVTEPTSGTTTALFPVTLSAPATSPVSVQWQTADGTVKAGTDYQAASGTLTFAAGQTQQTIAVTVDANATSDETFTVDLSNPSGATLGTSVGTGTIDYVPPPPPPPPSGPVEFQDTTDWGTGFTGTVTIPNNTTSPVTNWQLQFTFNGQITSIWDAQIVSHTGNTYVVEGDSWDSTIPAGGSVSFGFNGSPGNLTTSTAPGNFVLIAGSSGSGGTGSTGGGGTTTTTPTVTAVTQTLSTTEGQAASVNVVAGDTDSAGYTLTVTAYGQGQDGTVTLNSNGTLQYQPAPGFIGADSFSYTVSDGKGGSASAVVDVTVIAPAPSTGSTSSWSSPFFAPYVDMGLYPTYNLVSAMQNGGVKDFTLAFITADSNNQPSWAGYTEYEVGDTTFSTQMQNQIAAVQANGGNVMISFGGAAGTELAQAITNVQALTAAYAKVVNTYGVTAIDFDIEGAAEGDTASIDRRSQAIAALQQEMAAQGKTLQVWFTLPVLPTGLTADGLDVVQSALQYGVNISGVNIMTMDYGDGAAPNPAGQMGTYAIDALEATYSQLQTIYGTTKTSQQLWSMLGVTPMIGMNDLIDEVFTLQAAQQLIAFAQQVGLGRISMWSLNRDQEDPSGALTYVSNTSSSLVQTPYEFSQIFEQI